MKKRVRNSREIFTIILAILLIAISVLIIYGLIGISLSGNVIIRESSFFASSANTVTNIVSEWKFNEAVWTGAQGEVKDSIGNRNLTAFNGASVKGEGIDGKSGSFDGINDSVAGNIEMNFDSFSLSFWFNTLDTQSIKRIIEHGWSANGAVSGVFTTHLDRGIIYTGITFGDGVQAFLASGETINANKWHHYVLTYDGSSAKIYLDGALKSSLLVNKPIRKVSRYLIIGGAQGVTFNGSIDQVMIYSAALSGEEISALYTNQSSNLAVPSSSGAILINSCQNITSSGKFELTRNLLNGEIFSSGCFIINGSNSELDCNRKSIVNSTLNAGGIMIKNAFNVSIRNCNIQMNDASNESRGILISNSNNISLIGNVVNKNYIGIDLSGSSDNAIINNTANSNFLYGISLSRSNGNIILGNNFNTNTNGLLLSGSSNVIDLNVINLNLNSGVLLILTDFNKLRSNNIYRNGLDGILISISSNNTVVDNNISFSGRNGVWINSSWNNIFDSNSVNYNSGYGVSLVLGSNYNNVTKNKVGGNTFGTIYEGEGNIGNLIEGNVEIFYPEYCRNGVRDFNEEGIDCGGSCPLCQNNVRMIDNLELSLGVSELMKKSEKIRFDFDSSLHEIELFELYESSANFLFDSNSSFNLSLGERVRIDINEDSVFDILLFLYSLNSSNAEIFLQLISEPVLSDDSSDYEEPFLLEEQNRDNEEDNNFIPDFQQSFSQEKEEKASSTMEKKTFLEENYYILFIFGILILLIAIVIVIWFKTPKAE